MIISRVIVIRRLFQNHVTAILRPGSGAGSPSSKVATVLSSGGHRAQQFSRGSGRSLSNSGLRNRPSYGLGETRAGVVSIACCHRQGLPNRPVGGPAGQGASPPWPATYVILRAYNRLRCGYLRTMSQLYAAVNRKNRILGWLESGSDRR